MDTVEYLKRAKENPCDENIHDLEKCGAECAAKSGMLDAFKKMKVAAKGCQSLSDYVRFLNGYLQGMVNFEEAPDGIVMHLNKKQCSCPLYPKVSDGLLCHCTCGNAKVTWSEFFGEPVKTEIIESHLRGGKDCVIKIYKSNLNQHTRC